MPGAVHVGIYKGTQEELHGGEVIVAMVNRKCVDKFLELHVFVCLQGTADIKIEPEGNNDLCDALLFYRFFNGVKS